MTVPALPVEPPQARAATSVPPVWVSQPHRGPQTPRCRDRVSDRGRRCTTCWVTTRLVTPPRRWSAPDCSWD